MFSKLSLRRVVAKVEAVQSQEPKKVFYTKLHFFSCNLYAYCSPWRTLQQKQCSVLEKKSHGAIRRKRSLCPNDYRQLRKWRPFLLYHKVRWTVRAQHPKLVSRRDWLSIDQSSCQCQLQWRLAVYDQCAGFDDFFGITLWIVFGAFFRPRSMVVYQELTARGSGWNIQWAVVEL